MSRVVVAMSGGVDSSVAALLLKEAGHEVIGVGMRLWTEDGEQPSSPRRCCSVEDVDDARRVCQLLGIPFYFLNFERQFRRYVVDYFCREYEAGRTPNPCLACNRWLRFGLLLRKALAIGADYLATGHYARVERHNSALWLLRGVDSAKDQSYVLYSLGQRELEHLLLPLGAYHKEEARSLAWARGLPVWDKPESQEICFIPGGDYRLFLDQRLKLEPGDIVDSEGRVVGRHPGLPCFTIGQRRRLGLTSQQPLYVVGMDEVGRRLVVGPEDELYHSTLFAAEVSFVSGKVPSEPLAVEARIRYRSPQARAVLCPADGGVELGFEEPQRAISPGQAVVFYRGEEVLGGGIIQ